MARTARKTDTTSTAPPPAADAAAFRAYRAAPVALTLPASGLVVHARRAHIAELAAAGAIPDTLTGRVLERIGIDPTADGGSPDTPDELRDRLAENLALADAVCAAVLVAPRMSLDPDAPEDVLRPGDLPYRDREHVFAFACGMLPEEVAAQAATFPDPAAG